MLEYSKRSAESLNLEYQNLLKQFEACKAQNLNLNIARGKPSKMQLDQVSDILTVLSDAEECFDDSVDVRNYGELTGIPCAKKYWADVLGCKAEHIFVGGTSSLNFMFDVIARAYSHGLLNSERPWSKEEKVKFLCPSPGYDRHFLITEFFGAELIAVPMTETGPDMDVVEELVKDPQVKGIWCVPKYSNPDGMIYSDETVRRFAALKPAAPDFAIMWDNAYCVHEFKGDYVEFPDIIGLCAEAGKPHMVYEFASTSKITFAGGGFSAMAASAENVAYFSKMFNVQMISHDKVNQLRHVRYLQDKKHTLEIMKRHAKILAPKFDVVAEILDEQVKPYGIADWSNPSGGYFISFNAMPGTAKRILALCKEAGVVFTPAGATFPYGKDPMDSNIRIAPSLPPVEDLKQAMEVFCLCVKIAALEKLMQN